MLKTRCRPTVVPLAFRVTRRPVTATVVPNVATEATSTVTRFVNLGTRTVCPGRMSFAVATPPMIAALSPCVYASALALPFSAAGGT